MNSAPTILITGVSGFLGIYLADVGKLSQLGFSTQRSMDDGLERVADRAKALA
jgi:hypothetical protein